MESTIKHLALAAFLGAACISAQAADAVANTGYVKDKENAVVRSASGECVHTGTWTKDQANIEGCDGYEKPVPVVETTPEPVEHVTEQPQPTSRIFSLKADVLFDFNKSILKPKGKHALDQLHAEVDELRPEHLSSVTVRGYTDRIGSDKYNHKLSEARARAVANYLVAKNGGIGVEKVQVEGHGKAHPVTGHACDKIKNRKKLIACLGPDRRVEIEVDGSTTADVKKVVHDHHVPKHDDTHHQHEAH